MTRDEFNAYMTDAADSVKAPEALSKIRDGVIELFTSNEAAAAQAAKDKQKIDELQGVNMRMFLRGGAETSTAEEHDETIDEYKARMAAAIRGEEEKK